MIAIEPDPENLVCLEENLAQEIAAGKVTVVKAGVWDRKTRLSLQIDQGNSAAHSFVFASRGPNAEKVEGIEVLPLDDIVQDLQLNRVDFIKMDIEDQCWVNHVRHKSNHTCHANGPQCNEYKDTLLAAVKFFPSRLGFDAMIRTDGNDDRKAQNEDEPKCLFVFHSSVIAPYNSCNVVST